MWEDDEPLNQKVCICAKWSSSLWLSCPVLCHKLIFKVWHLDEYIVVDDDQFICLKPLSVQDEAGRTQTETQAKRPRQTTGLQQRTDTLATITFEQTEAWRATDAPLSILYLAVLVTLSGQRVVVKPRAFFDNYVTKIYVSSCKNNTALCHLLTSISTDGTWASNHQI